MCSRFIGILWLLGFLSAVSAEITAEAKVREWREETVELHFSVFWSRTEAIKAIRVKAVTLKLDGGKSVALVPAGGPSFFYISEGVTSFFLTSEFKFVGDRHDLAESVDHIEGAIEIYDPGRDPEACVLVADVFQKAGHLIKVDPKKNVSVFLADKDQKETFQKFLEAREEKLVLDLAKWFKVDPSEIGNNSIGMYVDGRDSKMNSLEFQNRNGIPLEGVRMSHFGNQYSIQFEKGYPADAVLAIYFLTKGSLYDVPLRKR